MLKQKQELPNIFTGDKLKEDILKRLLKIANDFISGLEIKQKPQDIFLTGSLTGYDYNKYSDLDLHILIDFDKSS